MISHLPSSLQLALHICTITMMMMMMLLLLCLVVCVLQQRHVRFLRHGLAHQCTHFACHAPRQSVPRAAVAVVVHHCKAFGTLLQLLPLPVPLPLPPGESTPGGLSRGAWTSDSSLRPGGSCWCRKKERKTALSRLSEGEKKEGKPQQKKVLISLFLPPFSFFPLCARSTACVLTTKM